MAAGRPVPELRIDPLSGLRTIVAGERAERPDELGGGAFRAEPQPAIEPATDPFLEGHEDQTPPELHALRPGGGDADGPGWTVRVVPNRYPALGGAPEAPPDAAPEAAAGVPGDPLESGRGEPQLLTRAPATGAHEVIVNTPRPVSALAELERDELERAMAAWRERIAAHSGARYVHLIVNEGRAAGASLPHTHAQLFALDFVPAMVARERERFTAYHDRTQGRNLLEDLLQEEVRLRERVVAVDSDAVVLCPFASRLPFQLQIVPRRALARFEDADALASGALLDALGRLAAVLGASPPLNLWVRTAPRGTETFCWRIDVLPRVGQLAGLEMGTGVHLNVVPPERAAAMLRDADGASPPGDPPAGGESR